MPSKTANRSKQQPESMTPVARRIVDQATDIRMEPPYRTDFLHSVLCQVAMPRKRNEGRIFERTSGSASILIEAGSLWNGTRWVEQTLPYGTHPRLVLVHISSEAVRTKSCNIEVGDSAREFLSMLGIPIGGGPRGGYTMFKKQMQALAACRVMLGYADEERAVTIDAKPIKRFEAWLQPQEGQMTMWPGVLELSTDFFESLINHAVPLDNRALAALKHSSLALDIYTWMAHRVYRIRSEKGLKLTWWNLYDQFGQEYSELRSFKKKFLQALHQVCAVYPSAKLEQVRGGLIFYPSPPPIPKTQVVVRLPEGGA